MTEFNIGGPAFPCTVWTPHGHKSGESMGMSLRTWFAGNAPPVPNYYLSSEAPPYFFGSDDAYENLTDAERAEEDKQRHASNLAQEAHEIRRATSWPWVYADAVMKGVLE